jgi:hypothetical protein
MDLTALVKPYLIPTDPPLDFSQALALGLLGDEVRTFHVRGVANTTTSWADLWGAGGIRAEPAATAGIVRIVSTSSSDASSGTGARSVEVVGWNSSWAVVTEVIDLDGTSTVSSSNSFHRVISARVVTAGTGGANVGTLTFTISSKTMAIIAIGDNASLHSHFTVPPDHIGYVYGWRFSAAKGGGQIDHGAIRFYVGPSSQVYHPHEQHALAEGGGSIGSLPLLVAGGRTELVVRAKSTGAGSERYVTTSYHVALFPVQ